MRLGLNPADIKLIIVTSAHHDHSGGVEYLKQSTGDRIAMSEIDWNLALSAERCLPRKIMISI